MTNERSVTRHPSLLLSVSDVAANRGDTPLAVYRPVPGALGAASVRAGSLPARRPGPDLIRKRRVAVLFGVGLLTLTGVGVASAASSHSGSASTVVHVVLPGESLWSIARDAKPSGDIRRLVAKLGEQVHGDQLHPGDELVVPVSRSTAGD